MHARNSVYALPNFFSAIAEYLAKRVQAGTTPARDLEAQNCVFRRTPAVPPSKSLDTRTYRRFFESIEISGLKFAIMPLQSKTSLAEILDLQIFL